MKGDSLKELWPVRELSAPFQASVEQLQNPTQHLGVVN